MKVKSTDQGELTETLDRIAEELKGIQDSPDEQKKAIDALSEDAPDDLKFFIQNAQRRLSAKLGKFEPRTTKTNSSLTKTREILKKKEQEELVVIEKTVVSMLRHHKKVKELTSEELFEAIAKDDKIGESELHTFLESCEKEETKEKKEGEEAETPALPTEDELAKLIRSIEDEEDAGLTKERFVAFIRLFMKVTADSTLTSALVVDKDSTAKRRLEVGEIVEVMKGPVLEEKSKLQRVFAKAMKDDIEGWVSLIGTAGTHFLEDHAGTFKVVQTTILTAGFDLSSEENKEATKKVKDRTRKLKEGEIVHVIEWPRKQEGSGMTRMRCKVPTDGATGWATTIGNTGTVYLQVV